MKTIIKNVVTTQEINKSEFITYLSKTTTTKEAQDFLKQVKDKHPKASHHVCVYIIGKNAENAHAGDDGEPSGTAAMPIMDVFKKNDITNITCIVVRYFGGIKLGAGGLIRAYSSSASQALKEAGIDDIKEYVDFEISFDYSLTGIIENRLKNIDITNKEFSQNVKFSIHCLKEDKEKISNELIKLTNNQIIIK